MTSSAMKMMSFCTLEVCKEGMLFACTKSARWHHHSSTVMKMMSLCTLEVCKEGMLFACTMYQECTMTSSFLRKEGMLFACTKSAR